MQIDMDRIAEMERNWEIEEKTGIGIRPIALTITCILAFIIYSFNLLLASTLLLRIFTLMSPILYDDFLQTIIVEICLLVSIAGLIGMWQMKKWSVRIYPLGIILQTISVLIISKYFSILPLIIPTIIEAIALKYYNRME